MKFSDKGIFRFDTSLLNNENSALKTEETRRLSEFSTLLNPNVNNNVNNNVIGNNYNSNINKQQPINRSNRKFTTMKTLNMENSSIINKLFSRPELFNVQDLNTNRTFRKKSVDLGKSIQDIKRETKFQSNN